MTHQAGIRHPGEAAEKRRLRRTASEARRAREARVYLSLRLMGHDERADPCGPAPGLSRSCQKGQSASVICGASQVMQVASSWSCQVSMWRIE